MRILFADDERNIREILTDELRRLGHTVAPCADGAEAVAQLEKRTFDVLILDLNMPKTGGLDVLRKARELGHDADAVILSGHGTPQDASVAVHLGITEFLLKPYKIADMEAMLHRIGEKRSAPRRDNPPRTNHGSEHHDQDSRQSVGKLIGNSEAMQQVHRLIDKIAPTDAAVVILGETGTGKELVAQAIHHRSCRKEKPFIAVNCGALPENLIESELFGHKKGSFTGAETSRTGLLEAANGGTLFLDEIGELPKGVQAKLLRFLESGEVRKVGDNTSAVCDVRVVCATLRNLETMVQEGTFREDLWFRMNTFEIELPPLRNRKEDLPELILHLLKRFRNDITETEAAPLFTPVAYDLLLHYDYPGNIRQLANTIEHALVLSSRFPIRESDLPAVLLPHTGKTGEILSLRTENANEQVESTNERTENTNERTGSTHDRSGSVGGTPPELPVNVPPAHNRPSLTRQSQPPQELMAFNPNAGMPTLRDMEMQAIEAALVRHNGSKAKAAEELGISLKTLYNKINNQNERQTA